jgi:hypothetical protein
MGMFTACFDASDQEKEHPYMVVAGFISSADEWIKFCEAWNEKLMEYGLDHFRASDCQNYQGHFATWKGNDAKRIALWCDLLTIIKGTTFQKFGCGIEVSDWTSRISRATKTRWRLNAYVLCSTMCAERARNWAQHNRINTPIEYVFESGDPGSGELKGHFEAGGYPPPVFKHKTNRMIDGIFYPAFTPLQAADFLAYEIFLTKKILAKKSALTISRPIAAIDAFIKRALFTSLTLRVKLYDALAFAFDPFS